MRVPSHAHRVAAPSLHVLVEGGVGEACGGGGVTICGETNLRDAGPQGGRQAHRARLATRVEHRAGQLEGAGLPACVPYGYDLGVGSWIVVARDTVHAVEHPSVRGHEHRSERPTAGSDVRDGKCYGAVKHRVGAGRFFHCDRVQPQAGGPGDKLGRVTPRTAFHLSGTALAVLLFVAHFSNDFFSGALSALLPTFQQRFGAGELTLAMLVATLSFSSSVLQPFFGAVADRLGRRVVAAGGVILSSAVLSSMAVAPSPLLLLPLLFFGGLGSAAFHPAGTSLARSAAKQKGGLALGVFSAGGTAGMSLGPLVIGLFIMQGWLPFAPLLMVPGVLFGLLIFLLVPPQPRDEHARASKIFDIELFKGPVGRLCLAGILRSMAWTSIINGAPLWLVNSRGLSPTDPVVFWTITTFTLSGAVGGIVAGLVEPRFTRTQLVTGTMLLATAPLFLMLMSQPGSVVYFALVAASGVLVNGGLPIMVVSAQDMAPHAVATASGMMMGLTWGTAGVLYLGVGALQEAIGMDLAMAISILPLLPGALIAHRVLTARATSVSAVPTNAP